MNYNLNPRLLFLDFLRNHIDDVKTRILLEDNYSQTIEDKKVINIKKSTNNEISHINNVKLDGVVLTKYQDWIYDCKHNLLLFNEFRSGEVSYDVYTGTNFIYHDEPKVKKLNMDAYPIISINTISSPSTVLGNNKAKIVTNYRFQIAVYGVKDSPVNVNLYDNVEVSLQDEDLTQYINKQVYDAFDNYRYTLEPYFDNYTLENKETTDVFDKSFYITRQEFTILQLKEKYLE